MADNRLNRPLQDETCQSTALEKFKAGAIVPDEGASLLVDYGRPQGGIAEHLAGHTVYTESWAPGGGLCYPPNDVRLMLWQR